MSLRHSTANRRSLAGRAALVALLLASVAGCSGGPMARFAEMRRQREVEKAIDKDPFPNAAEVGLNASATSTRKS